MEESKAGEERGTWEDPELQQICCLLSLFLSLCYRTMGGCGFSSLESGPGEEVGVPGEAADG